jgi:hypothetical protein
VVDYQRNYNISTKKISGCAQPSRIYSWILKRSQRNQFEVFFDLKVALCLSLKYAFGVCNGFCDLPKIVFKTRRAVVCWGSGRD